MLASVRAAPQTLMSKHWPGLVSHVVPGRQKGCDGFCVALNMGWGEVINRWRVKMKALDADAITEQCPVKPRAINKPPERMMQGLSTGLYNTCLSMQTQ